MSSEGEQDYQSNGRRDPKKEDNHQAVINSGTYSRFVTLFHALRSPC